MKLQQSVVAVGLALAMGLAHGAPVVLSGDTVEIAFEEEASYSAEVYSNYSGTQYQSSFIPEYDVVGDTLRLAPDGLYADFGGSGYADGGYVRFDLRDIAFTARAGYEITSYRVTFTGAASSVGDGSSTVGGSYGSAVFADDAFAFTAVDLPSSDFSGWIDLYAPYQANEDGTASVYGTAFGSIGSITVQAITRPVPEPETYALMLAGFAGAAVAARRRRQAA